MNADIEELQRQMQEQEKMKQEVGKLETAVKTMLNKEAISRYGNIKAADPEKAIQVLAVLGQLMQSGRISRPLSDEEFKHLLKQLTPEKKGIKIRQA